MTTERLARELKKVSVHWSDLDKGYFDWIMMATHVQKLIIQGKIEELNRMAPSQHPMVIVKRWADLKNELTILNQGEK